jgi:hypothetical protein
MCLALSGLGASAWAAGPPPAEPEDTRGNGRQNQDMQNVSEDMAVMHGPILAAALKPRNLGILSNCIGALL